jgi:hypothetical protein
MRERYFEKIKLDKYACILYGLGQDSLEAERE